MRRKEIFNIKEGDRVRSYDFPHRRDCYVEGTVVGLQWREGCNRYKIRVEKVCLENCMGGDKDGPGGPTYVFPPVNGTPSWHGIMNGVEPA